VSGTVRTFNSANRASAAWRGVPTLSQMHLHYEAEMGAPFRDKLPCAPKSRDFETLDVDQHPVGLQFASGAKIVQ
jgi:hypothetical protein